MADAIAQQNMAAQLFANGQVGTYFRPGANTGAGGGSYSLLEAVTSFKDTQGFGAQFNTHGIAAVSVPGLFGVASKDAGCLPKALRSNASTEQILGPSGLVQSAQPVEMDHTPSHGLETRKSPAVAQGSDLRGV